MLTKSMAWKDRREVLMVKATEAILGEWIGIKKTKLLWSYPYHLLVRVCGVNNPQSQTQDFVLKYIVWFAPEDSLSIHCHSHGKYGYMTRTEWTEKPNIFDEADALKQKSRGRMYLCGTLHLMTSKSEVVIHMPLLILFQDKWNLFNTALSSPATVY